MRKLVKQLMLLSLSLCLSGVMNITSYASEQMSFTIQKMVTATANIEAKKEPKNESDTIHTFIKGNDILVMEDVGNGWYSVLYQDKVGYIPQEFTVDKVIYTGGSPKKQTGSSISSETDTSEGEEIIEDENTAEEVEEPVYLDIDEEFSEAGEEITVLAEAIEAHEKETKRNLIWGAVIAVLVIAVIAVGVIAKVRENGEDEEK